MDSTEDMDWIAAERKHERDMKRLALEERKRQDAHEAWKAEERRMRLALFLGILAAAGVFITIAVLVAQGARGNSKFDNEQRITCLEQGGTPTQNTSNSSWLCLYLQKENE